MNEILLKNRDIPDSHLFSVYTEHGGYDVMKRAFSMPPEKVITTVEQSQLRGRGGGGFPVAMKWKFLPKDREQQVYLVCNADEGEPGTFKDREVMQFDPHLLIEGMVITAYAIGAQKGFIYIRGEYDWITMILLNAIEEAEKNGCLGENIMGSGFSFTIDVFRGAGSYVCGEETALIESLEGKPGRPRLRPPFPAMSGLYGKPTVIHNVTTLACIPYIIDKGPYAFRALGKFKRGGTKLFSISGHVNRPGLYEYPMGTNLRELIYEAAGGIKGGRKLKAVIPGGLSTPILKADETDIAMDYDPLAEVGSMLGSGGIIVMDESASIPLVAQKTAAFFAHESCGQCTPCREGTVMIKFLIDDLLAEKGSAENIEKVLELCRLIKGTTICAFGHAFTMPISSMINKFRDEFSALVST